MAAIFANINTPYINEATLKRVMSPAVKDNIFQQVQTKPGGEILHRHQRGGNPGHPCYPERQ